MCVRSAALGLVWEPVGEEAEVFCSQKCKDESDRELAEWAKVRMKVKWADESEAEWAARKAKGEGER